MWGIMGYIGNAGLCWGLCREPQLLNPFPESYDQRSCELCGDGTLVMPVGGDYEKSWPAVWLGLVVGSGGLEVSF